MVVNLKKTCLIALAAAGSLCYLTADDANNSAPKKDAEATKPKLTKEEVFSKDYISKLSESYGHLIYKSLESPVVKLDFNSVIKGLNEAKNGKSSPMNEQEYEEAVGLIQEYAFQDMAQNNLKEAEDFLKKNSKEAGVIELQPLKLQYQVLQKGKDDAQTVTEDMMPYVYYKGSYLNGTVFGSTQDGGDAVPILLGQTIPGFKQAIIGMKVGEKRKIFIHPDLGYGTSGQLSPNSLLIFEIEVTKVEPAPAQSADADSDDALTSDLDDDSSDSDGNEGEKGDGDTDL